MHPVEVMIEEYHLEILLFQSSKCSLGVLCEDRLWHPFPEPRNAVFCVLHNENRPVSGDVEFAHAIPSGRQRFAESIHWIHCFARLGQTPVTSGVRGEHRSAVVSHWTKGKAGISGWSLRPASSQPTLRNYGDCLGRSTVKWKETSCDHGLVRLHSPSHPLKI